MEMPVTNARGPWTGVQGPVRYASAAISIAKMAVNIERKRACRGSSASASMHAATIQGKTTVRTGFSESACHMSGQDGARATLALLRQRVASVSDELALALGSQLGALPSGQGAW